MIKLNQEQVRDLIPLYNCHIGQELEYAYRREAPFGEVKIGVYTDNISKPNTLLLIDGFAGTALYGDTNNDGSNQTIKRLISDCFDEEGKEIWLSLYSPGWELVIDTLFDGSPSWKAYRLIHRLNQETFCTRNMMDGMAR